MTEGRVCSRGEENTRKALGFKALCPHPLVFLWLINSPPLQALLPLSSLYCFWLCCAACGMLVPQPRVEPWPACSGSMES